MARFKQFIANTAGASTVEMGLICGLVILAMLGALNNLSNETNSMWNTVSSKNRVAVQKATGH